MLVSCVCLQSGPVLVCVYNENCCLCVFTERTGACVCFQRELVLVCFYREDWCLCVFTVTVRTDACVCLQRELVALVDLPVYVVA